ncbi:saccharopine dehydrogenase NADP-binding domain-containing protein (plasmid) [Embleya sp. NBC_00888]|uniref:saccharopine dehydrogenase family protein n=1 Tax=Embleya sp. NBC_00888 TaxID=2975960 RepID=UPI002F908783|nr:saccharopine dehydrogenase NADP-binding domain-containing protein [Embleya sp. NBC_00888]
MGEPRVVVVGGTGFYGRYVVDDLLRQPQVAVTVVARRRPAAAFDSPRVDWAIADHADVRSLARIVKGAAAVVHCAGPFQSMEPGGTPPWGPLRAALAAGVPYVDICEDRAFRRGALALARSASVPVLTGASVVPGLQALLVADMVRGLQRVDAIRCAAAPDTRRHRGPAMFAAMLHGAGLRFEAPRGGVPTVVHGWSEPEWVRFPPPIGRRLVHQVYEMADLDVLPDLFGARTVSFKAGSEFPVLNRALGAFAAVRARTGRPRRPQEWTSVVRGLSWLAGRAGDEAGAFMVEITGDRDGRTVTRRVGMTARRHGGRMPALLAGIAVERLLTGRLKAAGAVPLDRWLPPSELYAALLERDIRLWTSSDDDWHPHSLPSRLVGAAP